MHDKKPSNANENLVELHRRIILIFNEKELKNNATAKNIMLSFQALYQKLINNPLPNSTDILLGLLIHKRNKFKEENPIFQLINLALMNLTSENFYLPNKEQDLLKAYQDYDKKSNSSLFFSTRRMDFEKPSTKSLSKVPDRFAKAKETKAVQVGGGLSKGVLLKMPKNNEFFVAPHQLSEYFAIEIFNLIGIFTPKTRIIFQDQKPGAASKAIEGYIPIAGVRHDVEISDPKTNKEDILKIRKKYKLDIKRQVILDLELKQEYKISGNLFGTDEAAILVQDIDLQPSQLNLGFVRINNRFYTCAIDKEDAIFYRFKGKVPQQYKGLRHLHCIYDLLYKDRNYDQRLAVINRIAVALEKQQRPGEDKAYNDFERIFLNPRVLATMELQKEAAENKYLEQIIQIANVIFKNFENDIPEFRKREKVREEVAENVIKQLEKLGLSETTGKEALKKIIIEDLRAPYYQAFFKNKDNISEGDANNQTLISQIIDDLKKEFGNLLRNPLQNNAEDSRIKYNL